MQTIALESGNLTLAELVKRLTADEEIVITQNAEPVAKVTPAAPARPERGFGCARGLIQMAPDFDEPLECFNEYT